MLLSERINDPDVREFFPQGFFTDEEDDGGLARGDKTLNWLQRPFRSVHVPTMWVRNPAVGRRRKWAKRYFKSLENRRKREAEYDSKWKARAILPHTLHEYNQRRPRLIVDVPMVHNRWALNCGREYYLHLNGMRYTRLNREKLSQIVVSMHVQGYIKVDTGYYVLTRGRYERTIRFHDCTLNPNKAWVVSSVRD